MRAGKEAIDRDSSPKRHSHEAAPGTVHPDRDNQRKGRPVEAALHDLAGAEERNRTSDLLITNQLLYRLSYFGIRQGAGV